jgi:spore coat protein U-like protein
MRNALLLAAAAALLFLPVAASAQANATIEARARVLTPLTVTANQDLDFQTVIPGLSKTVAPGDVQSGIFDLTGSGTLEVQLDFGTLPTTLVSGSDNLPISFGSSSAGYSTSLSPGVLTFDPAVNYDADLESGAMTVYIGGTVTPASNQPAGLYTNDITLTVSYTGN